MTMSLPTRSTRLSLESLHDRVLPATLLPLFAAGSEVEQPGFIARQGHTQPAPNSQLDVFLAVDGDRDQAEQGYNTNARPLQFDEDPNLARTHAIQVGDVPVVDVD